MATHAISARAYRNAELEGGQVCVCRWCESQPRRATKRGKDLRKASSSGAGGGGALTVKSSAGIGVQRFTWIMASTLGRWPSLAPAKNSLVRRKVGQPGIAWDPLSRGSLIHAHLWPPH